MIPFIDLKRQYLQYKEEIDIALQETFEESRFILGDAVIQFENEMASYLGVEYVIGCGSGTDALELILKAYGIGDGDEVIVPAFTWVSNAEAVCNVGALPVFVDVDPTSFNIDTSLIESKITSNTKAIMAVHLYGMPCEVGLIMELANKYDIKVIEDVAQALGATSNGKKLGAIGHAAALSFYPTKNLGAYGDAGAIVTNDKALADHLRLMTNHGQKERDVHLINGRNSRLDTIQAAILRVKLRYLNQMNSFRKDHARYYHDLLGELNIQLPAFSLDDQHVNHIYAIRTEERDRLKQYLLDRDILTAIHYPTPLPTMPPYQCFAKSEAFPIATGLSATVLSLPIFPELTKEELHTVVQTILEFFD